MEKIYTRFNYFFRKRHRINLKGWLKTPADWERFDAWAKINAQPKKVPEQEPIVNYYLSSI